MSGSNPATDGSGYAAQAGLNTPGSEFNVIEFIVSQMIAKIGTIKLVKVTKVKSEGELAVAGLIDVQILVDQMDGLGKTTRSGEIFDVPYIRVQGGKNAVIADPVVGDIGLMFCCDRDVTNALKSKKQAPPGSFRKFDAADGIYLGGLSNGIPEQYVRFKSDGVELADKNGKKLSSDATGWTFTGLVKLSDGVQIGGTIAGIGGGIYGGDIKTTGQVLGGTVQQGSIVLGTHKHVAQGATAQTTGPVP